MIIKLVKYGAIAGAGAVVIGGLLFGKDLASYVHSSARSVQDSIKDSVPVEFELRRARDMVEQIIPELHANIRLIAQEEVEIAALKNDIATGDEQITEQRMRLARLRDQLQVHQASYTFGNRQFTRGQVTQELARRFDRFREAEVMLASKQRLLETREKSLTAAMTALDHTRHQKAELEQQIEALAGQHRLVQAASVVANIEVDNSKLAQSQKLIRQIKKRLDVAERVLAHQASFVETIDVDVIDEQDLLADVDDYFGAEVEVEPDVDTEAEANAPAGAAGDQLSRRDAALLQ